MLDGDNLCEPFILLGIIQDGEVSAVLVFAHICTAPVFACVSTPPVFEAGGYTDIVFATIDCNATANVQNPDTAN